MISIVIPLYNKAATIERAVRSVLNQTIQNFELIVVNNGSTDGSEEVVKIIQDPRITFISQDNQGVSMARNKGVETAQSEWVAFLDADDEWKPTFLETVLRLKEQYTDCSVCATAYQRCNAHGVFEDIKLQGVSIAESYRLDNYFEVAAVSDPPFCSISVMVKKEALLAVGGFPNGVHQGEDLLTWARLAASYKIAYSPTPQSIFYTGEQSAMDHPKRIPADDDIVGRELAILYNQKQTPGLKQYIAKWHKMRASIYLRLPNGSRKCRKEIREAQHWHRNPRLALYYVFSLCPYKLRMFLGRTISKLHQGTL